jgi:hypothetical protein
MLRHAVPALGGLLFTGLWLAYRDFWLDDSFITFRYARNLAEGLGPVFNPGEFVEGYTNFLWMLVTALPFVWLDDLHALLVIKYGGLALGLFILWQCWTFPAPSRDGEDGPARWLVLLLAVNPVFVASCGDGLETPLFTALLLGCARSFAAPPSARTGARTGAALAGAVWTRPESLPLLIALPALLAACRHGDGLRTEKRSWHRGFALAAVPPVLGHLAWRWWYYGALVPNTFYAKATGDLQRRIADGLADVASFVTIDEGVPAFGLWIFLALAGTGLASARRRHDVGLRVWLAGLWTLVAFRVAFDVWSGSEYMGFFRFLAPALPPLVILADDGLRRLLQPSARRLAVAACVLAFGVGVAGNAARTGVHAPYQAGLREAHMALGAWLAETYPPDTVVAIGDAGAVPFFSRLPIIDLWGLTDPVISRLPGNHRKREGVASYALMRRPGVIVLRNRTEILREPGRFRVNGGTPFDAAIFEQPTFRREYHFVREFTFRKEEEHGSGYYLDVFEHRPVLPTSP